MAEAKVRGVTLNYQVVGNTGLWIEFTPGGRRGYEELVPFAERIASAGYRVLLHDRRNCGVSDIVIGGDQSEYEIWADDLHELLVQLKALPVIVGGSSSGCRLSAKQPFLARSRDAAPGAVAPPRPPCRCRTIG